jgi:hypothetical protein
MCRQDLVLGLKERQSAFPRELERVKAGVVVGAELSRDPRLGCNHASRWPSLTLTRALLGGYINMKNRVDKEKGGGYTQPSLQVLTLWLPVLHTRKEEV